MKKIVLILALAWVALGAYAQMDEGEVVLAINRMQERYPQITLCDIYKSFYQEHFGPGHIIESQEKAENYLMQELERTEEMSVGIEPTGVKGEFVRVDVFYVKTGKLEMQAYLKALMNSVVENDSLSVQRWLMEWDFVQRTIERRGLKIENYKEDKEFIRQRIEKGVYEMNHSRLFNKLYHPHYRIIRRDIFESDIRPELTE